ncbi:L,D-transpeptidase family protein [Sulfurovum sp.]|uniref:L,D-transpeptidase family protein n=1 Tax=Sulfurovum sp. TaxID=1969726 RepID=UPI0025EF8F12|nr:L,D-transpeptidase family protein [Sulfurovum sp.]
MKKILFILIHITFLFASAPDSRLKAYQERYTFCHGKTDYQIAQCLLNGSINRSRVRGDRSVYRTVSKSQIKQALSHGDIYDNILNLLPHTKRYIWLEEYLDYLYDIRTEYFPPKFRGNNAEDIIRIKRIFNLLQNARLVENADYTYAFEDELIEYQRRHGLKMDGKIGPRTKRILKQSITSIILKVKKNLEWERISSIKGSNYILVNIPEFWLHCYDYGEAVLSMKVIVGKNKLRTPMLNRTMQYIVINPRWNVPSSIYNKEYAHKSESYLKAHGFAYNSEGRLYQKPGRNNALGVVKFLFPNPYKVYMHDTPIKSLFHKTVRTFSHGCIRLEKPLDLLNYLGYEYTTDENKWITLSNRIPVHVEYHTVWIDDDGIVQFRNDIYGYERTLFH